MNYAIETEDGGLNESWEVLATASNDALVAGVGPESWQGSFEFEWLEAWSESSALALVGVLPELAEGRLTQSATRAGGDEGASVVVAQWNCAEHAPP